MEVTRTPAFRRPPDPHQQEALDRMRGKPAFALLMEAGTGKTKVLLDDAAWWVANGRVDTVVILAPAGVHRQWIRDELPKDWSPDVPLAGAVFNRGSKLRKDWRTLMTSSAPGVRVFAINSEAFSSESGRALARDTLRGRKYLLIVDESQDFKTPSSKRTRGAWEVADKAVAVRIASGTSITKGWEDWYAQFRLLSWEVLGAKTYTAFKTEYCLLANRGGYDKIVGYRNVERLLQRVAPVSYRKRLDEVVRLPERSLFRRPVVLSDDQRRLYQQLRDTYLLELSSGLLITEEMAATRLTRLQQIVGGHVPADEDAVTMERIPGPNPKLDAVRALLDQTSVPIIVWARFRPELDLLVKELPAAGFSAVPYHGGVSDDDRQHYLDRFRGGGARVLVANPATLARGHTINEAKAMIYFSNSFRYEHREQSLARNYRRGQGDAVTVWDLVAPGTVDTKILSRLEQRGDIARGQDSLRDYLTMELDD